MIPLSMARPGETVTIRKITGKDEVRQHLAELGFVVEESVTVVSGIGGNLILQVKDSRIALVLLAVLIFLVVRPNKYNSDYAKDASVSVRLNRNTSV